MLRHDYKSVNFSLEKTNLFADNRRYEPITKNLVIIPELLNMNN